jgi:small-conductance mechanosensitive channel
VDIEKAKNLLKDIFLQDKRILEDTVVVWLDSLGDWSVNIGIA